MLIAEQQCQCLLLHMAICNAASHSCAHMVVALQAVQPCLCAGFHVVVVLSAAREHVSAPFHHTARHYDGSLCADRPTKPGLPLVSCTSLLQAP